MPPGRHILIKNDPRDPTNKKTHFVLYFFVYYMGSAAWAKPLTIRRTPQGVQGVLRQPQTRVCVSFSFTWPTHPSANSILNTR